jgi:hypothetical protein
MGEKIARGIKIELSKKRIEMEQRILKSKTHYIHLFYIFSP